MVRAALLCLASAFLMAATPWPKDKPVAPVEYTSPEALKAVATTGILKAGEWSAKRSGNPKVSRAFKLAGAAADFPEIRDAWRKGDRVKAAFLLSWTMIKYGCPPADAADFAGRAVAAGTLAAKDATNQRQLDEAFASYKAASGGTGSDAWGWRQGFLSRSVRSELRKKHPDFSERDLDRMERVAMATYCENRLYRERFDGHKKQVRAWLKDGGVRWSGDEAALEKFLATMDEVERLIQARRAQDGLFDKERLRLAQAIFRVGSRRWMRPWPTTSHGISGSPGMPGASARRRPGHRRPLRPGSGSGPNFQGAGRLNGKDGAPGALAWSGRSPERESSADRRSPTPRFPRNSSRGGNSRGATWMSACAPR